MLHATGRRDEALPFGSLTTTTTTGDNKMTQETNFQKLEQEEQSRREWAEFNARRNNETRLEFVARVATMMLRGTDETIEAGDEFFLAQDVANELEALVFELNQTNQTR
jgi:hypothetical protein